MSEIAIPKISQHTRGKLFLITSVLAVLLGGGILWWHIAHPSFGRYSAALEAMRNHNITVDRDGRVDLSKQFPGLTPRDFALVTWLGDGSFRAVFPTDQDKDAALSGLMYTSRPLQEDDTRPRPGNVIHFDQRTIKVGSYDWLVVDEKLNESWYRVSYKIH